MAFFAKISTAILLIQASFPGHHYFSLLDSRILVPLLSIYAWFQGCHAFSAPMAQYTDKQQNGIVGVCTSQSEGAGKMSISCNLDADDKLPIKAENFLFASKEIVQIRPALASGSKCNDICHLRRNFEFDQDRSDSCLGGAEQSPETWTQTCVDIDHFSIVSCMCQTQYFLPLGITGEKEPRLCLSLLMKRITITQA
jgi:hypothetical protein